MTINIDLNLKINPMRKLLIFILIIFNSKINAQYTFAPYTQDDINHLKYWHSRSKLRNDFMKIGLGQGESLPFVQRGLGTHIDGVNPSTIYYKTALKGGDLISELGIYIGVLASEYKILKDNSQKTDSTIYELYCALNAANRLDYNAESSIYGNASSLNGFFIRDDIPLDFVLNNYKHFNYYTNWDGSVSNTVKKHGYYYNSPQNSGDLTLYDVPNSYPTDRGFMSGIALGQWETSSVFAANQANSNNNNMAMSQDHMISLLYGLRMVTSLVDNTANYNGNGFLWGDQNITSISKEAGKIAERIVNFLKNNQWQIKRPNGTTVSNAEGGDAYMASYAIAEAAGVTNLVNVGNPSQNPVPMTNTHYHNLFSQTTGFISSQTILKSNGITFDQTTQYAELSASCNCLWDRLGGFWFSYIQQVLNKIWSWLGTIFGWIYQVVNTVVSYFVPVSWQSTTTTQMLPNATHTSPNAGDPDKRIFYPQDHALLAHQVLNNPTIGPLDYISYQNSNTRVKNVLNSFPCNGSRNFTDQHFYDSYDVFEWSTYSLIEHTNAMGRNNDFLGEYNNLDYMLLHNLYYILNGAGHVKDISSMYINYALPTGNGTGSVNNPLVLQAFEYITADNIVNTTAKLDYYAGKIINLKPGFEARGGAIFGAHIAPYTLCSSGARLMDTTNNSNNDSSKTKDVIPSNIATTELHHVNYPKEEPKTKAETSLIMSKQPINYNIANKKIINLNDKMSIYPNPNNGVFNIEINNVSEKEKFTLNIYDMNGKKIKIYENLNSINNIISISEPDLIEGAYIANVVGSNGYQLNQKIIVKK